MPVRFRCVHCSQKLSVTRRLIGASVTCPRCGKQSTVPPEDTIPPHADRPDRAPSAQPHTATPAPEEVPEFTIRNVQTEFEEMDLTPMVDVTFLLLIFFMITASFSVQKTIETPEPNPDQKGARQQLMYDDLEAMSLLIAIDADNTIHVENEPIPAGAYLADVIRDKCNAANKRDVLLAADDDALHDTVIRVIDACNEAGIQKIRLVGGGSGFD